MARCQGKPLGVNIVRTLLERSDLLARETECRRTDRPVRFEERDCAIYYQNLDPFKLRKALSTLTMGKALLIESG